MKTLAVIVAAIIFPLLAHAQNPIQWNANVRAAVDRAAEQQLPVMFWVTDGEVIIGDSELQDAQAESFRDPVVVAIAQYYYVPVRVNLNSRVLEEAQKLGLPTTHGLYVALVTSDGHVLDQIGADQVADPQIFAERLTATFRSYRDALYKDTLQSIITSPDSPKTDVRQALHTVWRLNILSADKDIVGLLNRKDLTPLERKRLYSILAAFATKPSVDALLSRAAAGDRDAASALDGAEGGALEFLLPQVPTADTPTDIQIAAYNAAAKIAGQSRQSANFWKTAKPEERTRELDALHTRAVTVLEYWKERNGRWR
jgi:hypothetical protein